MKPVKPRSMMAQPPLVAHERHQALSGCAAVLGGLVVAVLGFGVFWAMAVLA